MQEEIHINLPGKPITKLRPRFSRWKTKVKTYDKQSTEKKTVRWQLKARMLDRKPYEGCVHLILCFVFKRPKSRKSLRETYHRVKPDLDNLIKWIGDVGNGILWHDDAQIVRIEAHKQYGDEECTIINVRELDHGNTIKRGLQPQEDKAEDIGTETGCPAEVVELYRACLNAEADDVRRTLENFWFKKEDDARP